MISPDDNLPGPSRGDGQNPASTNRREFLSAAVATAAGGLLTPASMAQPATAKRDQDSGSFFAGIQISPISLLDEGIERCLDRLQEIAAINTLVCYTHTYHQSYERPPEVLATDHGIDVRDIRNRRLPRRWVSYDESRFVDLPVRHEEVDDTYEFHDRDLFDELIGAAHQRGMKVHGRMLEAGSHRCEAPGYADLATIRLDGTRGSGPCWNNPVYRQWLRLTIDDVMARYPLDGFQYGAERVGGLSNVLFRGRSEACFCRHCVDKASNLGIDAERAREGYKQLEQLVRQGRRESADGMLVSVLRVLLKCPEVLAWENAWYDADEEICKMVGELVKLNRPMAQYGRHIDHQRSSWDPLYRAAISYGEIARHCDYIKPILYHDILGPRMRWWVVERMQDHALLDFDNDQVLTMLYEVLGYDADHEPGLDQLEARGLSPEYVFRETHRCVEGANGAAVVYAGIGIDVPWHIPKGGMAVLPSDPKTLYQACVRAVDAGAGGLLASREYEEMRMSSLATFGNAVRDATKNRLADTP